MVVLQISEAIDLITAMMETPGKKDQIYLLMYEKDMAEVLYVLLTGAEYSANFKEKVLKVGQSPCSSGLLTLPDTDSDTDSYADSKPNGYIILYRNCSLYMDSGSDCDPDLDP